MARPEVPGPSGYVLHLWVSPGASRRDCTFAYGTLEQLQFVLRQEYQPRPRASLDRPLLFATQHADLMAVDNGREVARLDLRAFVTLSACGLSARLDDTAGLDALLQHPLRALIATARFEILWDALEAALPRLVGPPLQPGGVLAFGKGRDRHDALYGYRSDESWKFPHDREPAPPRRVRSRKGYVAWGSQPNDRFPELGPLRKVPRASTLALGAPRRTGFPRDAWFEVLDNLDGRLLSDNPIAPGHRVVSKALRDALKPLLGASRVEFLPVRVKETRGRRAAGTYFVMNPIDVLAPEDVHRDVVIYRPRDDRAQIRLRADVAWALESGDFTQLDFEPV